MTLLKPRQAVELLRSLAITLLTQATLCRKPVRWCPHCGESSSMTEWRWLLIEARDEMVICSGCVRAPRLWLAGRSG